jgi:Kef-type K+ transport system membrane component KefB
VEHGIDLASFLLAFGCALLAAKLLGELAERLGQPAVLGELTAPGSCSAPRPASARRRCS